MILLITASQFRLQIMGQGLPCSIFLPFNKFRKNTSLTRKLLGWNSKSWSLNSTIKQMRTNSSIWLSLDGDLYQTTSLEVAVLDSSLTNLLHLRHNISNKTNSNYSKIHQLSLKSTLINMSSQELIKRWHTWTISTMSIQLIEVIFKIRRNSLNRKLISRLLLNSCKKFSRFKISICLMTVMMTSLLWFKVSMAKHLSSIL